MRLHMDERHDMLRAIHSPS